MKLRKIFTSLIPVLVLLICFSDFDFDVLPGKNYISYKAMNKGNEITINSYNDFYKATQSVVLSKGNSLTLKIKNYNSKTYNLDDVIKKIQCNNPKLNYIVSGYSCSKYISDGYSTITILLKYISSDKTANNYSEFYNHIRTAALGKKTAITIKLNKYTSAVYNINKIWSKLNSEKFNGYSVAQCSWKTVVGPDSSNILMVISLSYRSNLESKGGTIGNTGVTLSNQQSDSRTSVRTYNELYNAIKIGLTNVTSISLKIENNTMNTNAYILNVVNKVVYDNPDLKYFKRVNCQSIGDYYTVNFDYSFTRERILAMRKAVDDKVNYIVSHYTNSKMSEYQKELALHDYVVKNTSYDSINYERGTIPDEDYTAYGALFNGKAVCEGYANAVYKLLKAAGIDNMIAVGYANGEAHAWNIVKIGGEYYHMDSTWDDPVLSNGGNVLSHKYFNLTDSQMVRDHSWDVSKYPKCISTRYKYSGR